MTWEKDLRHTVTSEAIGRAIRRHVYRTPRPEPRGAIAGFLSELWDILCGR